MDWRNLDDIAYIPEELQKRRRRRWRLIDNTSIVAVSGTANPDDPLFITVKNLRASLERMKRRGVPVDSRLSELSQSSAGVIRRRAKVEKLLKLLEERGD